MRIKKKLKAIMGKGVIKSFNIFEARLRDNRGLSKDYLDNIKSEEERKSFEEGRVDPMQLTGMAIELNRLHGGRLRPTPFGMIPSWPDKDKKEKIEKLAKDIIEEEYGRIIDVLNIDMDIKLVDPDEMRDMKGEMGENEEESENNLKPNMEEREIDDEDLIADIEKRKLVNVITQGSAKNVHRLIHLYKNKIDEVDPQIFNLMDRLIKTQERMEWQLPEEEGMGKLIIQFMNGYSKVEFEDEEDEEEVEEKVEEFDLDSLLSGDEDEMEEFEEKFEDFSGKIKVTSRGIDLVILLHEAVKGIYEVLGSPSLPEENEERANQIMYNTDTANDEFEDLRYGPRIRQDLLNWINSNNKIDKLEDPFEYVWGAMVQLTNTKFLEIFKDAIIGKTGVADRWLDKTLDDLIQSFEEYDQEVYNYEEEERQDNDGDEWKQETGYADDQDFEDEDENDSEELPEETGEVDYSEWSERDLERELDRAFDNNDMELVRKLGEELNKR
jgi:hypothetical protein